MVLRYSQNILLARAMHRGPVIRYGDFQQLQDGQYVFVELIDVSSDRDRPLFMGLCHVKRIDVVAPGYLAAYDGEKFIGDLDPHEDPESALWKEGDKVEWTYEGVLTRVYRAPAKKDN